MHRNFCILRSVVLVTFTAHLCAMKSTWPKVAPTGFPAMSPFTSHNDTAPTALTVSLGDIQVFRADLSSGNLEVSPAHKYAGISDYPESSPSLHPHQPVPKPPAKQGKHKPVGIVKVPKISPSADFSMDHYDNPLPSQFAGKSINRVGSTYADEPNSPVFLPDIPSLHKSLEPRRRAKGQRSNELTSSLDLDQPSPKQWMYDLYYYGKPKTADVLRRKTKKERPGNFREPRGKVVFSEKSLSTFDPDSASFIVPRKPDFVYNTSPSRHYPVDYSVDSPYHLPEVTYDPTYYKHPKPYKHNMGQKKSPSYDDVIAAYHPSTSRRTEEPMIAAGSVNQDAYAVYHSKNTLPYNAEDYGRYPYGGYSASRSGLSTASFGPSRPPSFDGSQEAIDITFELPPGGNHRSNSVRSQQFDNAPHFSNSRQFDTIPNIPNTLNSRTFDREPVLNNADTSNVNAPSAYELRGFPAENQTPQASNSNAAQHVDRGTLPSFMAIDGSNRLRRTTNFDPQSDLRKLPRPHPGFGYLTDPAESSGFSASMTSMPFRQEERSRPQMNFLGPILRSYIAKGGDIGSFELFDYDKFDRRSPFFPGFL